MPYDAAALARAGDPGEPKADPSDVRSRFARDRDRVIYCSAFQRLAGKTQVVGAEERGLYHTRLTHSLKVAQLGRRLAERLRDQHVDATGAPRAGGIASPDPDLVEAACLAHDLGHPPFGHVGEETLCATFDELAKAAHPFRSERFVIKLGGFEGNAQTFRVISFLSARMPIEARYGLDLTRATMDAATKYPRVRGRGLRKWGAIEADRGRLEWVRDREPYGPFARASFEAQLMDWCDDVTYAVHDVIDFYRSGQIPLHTLLMAGGPLRRPAVVLTDEAVRFLEEDVPRLKPSWDSEAAKVAWLVLTELADFDQAWEPTQRLKAQAQSVTSAMITYFVEHVGWKGQEPCLHAGDLVVDTTSAEVEQLKRYATGLLKLLLRVYVIEQPALATQQAGAKRIVQTLLKAYVDGPPELFPADRREELAEHGDKLRAAADHVASLTERDAVALYQRITGTDLGYFSDRYY